MNVDAIFEKACSLLDAGIPAAAIDLLNSAIKKRKDDVRLLNLRGICWSKLNEHQHAIADYSKAISIDSHFEKGFKNRGVAFTELGQLEDAIQDLTEAIRLNDNYAAAFVSRAIAWEISKEYTKAKADFLTALQINPVDDTVYYDLALCHLADEETDECLNCLAKAIELRPSFALAYTLRGDVQMKRGEFAEAVASYCLSLNYDAEHHRLHEFIGHAALCAEQFELAITHLTTAIEYNDAAPIYHNRGSAFLALKRFGEAIEDFTTAIEKSPDSAETYLARGMALARQSAFDKFERAKGDFQKAMQLKPRDDRAFDELANLYASFAGAHSVSNRYMAAIEWQTQAVDVARSTKKLQMTVLSNYKARRPFSHEIDLAIQLPCGGQNKPTEELDSAQLGVIAQNAGDFEGAIDKYTEALSLAPDVDVYLRRAAVYHELGDFDAALKDQTRVLELDSNSQGALLNRAQTLERMGKHESAINDFTRVIDMAPDFVAVAYYGRAGAFVALGRKDAADNDLSRAFELDPRLLELLDMRQRAIRLGSEGSLEPIELSYEHSTIRFKSRILEQL